MSGTCEHCGAIEILIEFHDYLYERRTLWLCHYCEAVAQDHETQLLMDEIADEHETREPEASYL